MSIPGYDDAGWLVGSSRRKRKNVYFIYQINVNENFEHIMSGLCTGLTM